jgi:uncharacterized protein YbjT (DUF2867 family)
MILVVGGSGTLGRLVSGLLLEQGRRVRVMSREPSRAADVAGRGAELVEGDLLDKASLVRACEGATAVVAAAHAILGRGRRASVHVDGEGHRRLIDAAGAAGVRHFVYTSVRDAGPAHEAVPFFRIKREVEQYLRSSGLPHTIIRPTAFLDLHAHVLIGEPVLAGRRVVLVGRGDRPRNYVAAGDVARLVVKALAEPQLAGRTITIGSSRDLSPMDVVRIYERRAGRPAKITRIPLPVAGALSRAFKPVHPGVSQILQLAVVTERDGEPALDGSQPDVEISPTSLEEWLDRHAERRTMNQQRTGNPEPGTAGEP